MNNQVLDENRVTAQIESRGSSVERGARRGSRTRSYRWSPYVVGTGLGVLSWVAFAVVNQPLGISTALSAASGACAALFVGWEDVLRNAYWSKHVAKWDYGTLFLVGTMLGALVSALVSKSFRIEKVPRVWAQGFGHSPAVRFVGAFIGGVLVMYGARMAGGCTSGHGISGTLQLALSSWVFFLVMFVAGTLTALLLFRKTSKPGRASL
ncbi:MAG: YeeE/YedE family protein [Verrucomicrobia subdivision 3 bacterium]|nr:YeeE/YedE family protein [Limisphaerales bacterium]